MQGRRCLLKLSACRSRPTRSLSAHGEHVTDHKNLACPDDPSYRWKGTFSKSASDGLEAVGLQSTKYCNCLPFSVGNLTVLRKHQQATMACGVISSCSRFVVSSRAGEICHATAAFGCKRASDLYPGGSEVNRVPEGFKSNCEVSGAGDASVGARVLKSWPKGSTRFTSRKGPAETRRVHFRSTSYNSGQPSTALEYEAAVRSLKSSDGGVCILDSVSRLRVDSSAADFCQNVEAIPAEETGPLPAQAADGPDSESVDMLQFDALRSGKPAKDGPQFSARSMISDQEGIHQTAIVHPDAILGEGVEIGPFCTVGPNVKLGDRCKLHSNAHVAGETQLGQDCVLLTGAIVGADIPGCTIVGDGNAFGYYSVVGVACQDMKYKKGDPCFLEIGNNNDIREYASIQRSSKPSDTTVICDNNLIMGSCHVAHDCKIGNRNILANGTLLGGHIVIEDFVHTGGAAAVHQFCHLSSYSFLAGGTMVDRDVPMFMMVAGDRAELRGLNLEGMRRCGFSDLEIRSIRKAYQRLFMSSDPNAGGIEERLYLLAEDPELSSVPIVSTMLKSVRDCFGDRRRGICKFRNWTSL